MTKHLFTAMLTSAVLLTSCGTLQNKSSNMSSYYNKTPDLSKVIYEGGDGKSMETSVVIKNAVNERNGIAAEYDYIAKKHGTRFTNWKPTGQSTSSAKGKVYDIINIVTLPGNETIVYYFDITDFYGKF